jgi:hypothetical protein
MPMRIRIDDPLLIPDLLVFLERVRCGVRKLRGGVLEVSVPEAPSPEQACRELELYLLAWHALHPDAGARVASAPVVVPPQPHP